MTSYNRVDKTMLCLKSLYEADLPEHFSFDVFLVDDNSPDKTGEKVKSTYPQINIIKGTGNLYWAGGMRLAWEKASEIDYQHFLWLNDDIELFKDFWRTVEKGLSEISVNSDAIYIGTTVSATIKEPTYGGRADLNRQIIIPNGKIQCCKIINGNFVLVSIRTWQKIGIIDRHFTHIGGDIDYGIRALKNGISLYVLPEYIGKCNRNALPYWSNPDYSLGKRWRYFKSPKGVNPKEFFYLIRKYFPAKYFVIWFKIYFRLLFPHLVKR